MDIKVYCPSLKNGMRSILFCVYKCTKSRLVKCPEYTKLFPQLLAFTIPEQYLEKYGHPTLLVPTALRKRRKRRAPKIL